MDNQSVAMPSSRIASPINSHPAPPLRHTQKLVQKEAEKKLEVMQKTAKILAGQLRLIYFLKYLMAGVFLGVQVFSLVSYYQALRNIKNHVINPNKTLLTIEDLPHKLGFFDWRIHHLSNVTFEFYANVTLMITNHLVHAVVNSLEATPNLTFWSITSWVSILSACAMCIVVFAEGKFEQKEKRLRKKVTECEIVLEIHGKGRDKWDNLYQMLMTRMDGGNTSTYVEELM